MIQFVFLVVFGTTADREVCSPRFENNQAYGLAGRSLFLDRLELLELSGRQGQGNFTRAGKQLSKSEMIGVNSSAFREEVLA